MDLVIEHSETKRRISGSFRICGSYDDLLDMIRQLEEQLTSSDGVYGWLEVNERQEPIANTPPKGWDE